MRLSEFSSRKFIKQNKIYFIAALSIFLFFTIIGFIFPIFFTEKILEIMKEMSLMIEGKNTFQLITMIFFNNVKVSFMSIVLGLGLGIFPIITATINGYLLGFVSRKVIQTSGPSSLLRLLPHGIFELPAIFFSIGIGLKLGSLIFKKMKKNELKKHIKESIFFFIKIIIPLLLIAAIIEGFLISMIQ